MPRESDREEAEEKRPRGVPEPDVLVQRVKNEDRERKQKVIGHTYCNRFTTPAGELQSMVYRESFYRC